MKSIKTYPNIFWVTANLIFLSFFGMLILVCLEWIFEFNTFFKNRNENKFGMTFLLVFVLSIFLYFYHQLSNQFIFAKLKSNEITIFQLLKLKIKKLNFREIRGYSKSEISYGRIPANFCSKSIVIYTNETQFELIKIFNFNFYTFENELRKTDIQYFGKEPYQIENIYKRKYRFIK